MSKTKILALIIVVLVGSVIFLYIIHSIPEQETKPEGSELETTPLKDHDAQITEVTFFPNGSSITVYLENKGNKSFKFKSIVVSGGLHPISYDIGITTIYSLEKFNVTLKHYWKPSSSYTVSIGVLYEGEEKYTTIKYNTYSPSTYPYILEITNVTFAGTKIYDELGALIGIRNKNATITFVNHHDTIDLTIMEIRPEETHSIWVHYRLLPKQTANMTFFFEWEEGRSYRILMIAIRGEPREGQDVIAIDDEVYYSNYYHCHA